MRGARWLTAGGRAGALLVTLSCAAACSPALSIASAIMSGSDGTSSASPYAGTPSSTQNRDPYDPMIDEALAAADQNQVTETCKARLPPVQPVPAKGCAIRLSCLPGAETPMALRLCASDPGAVLPLHSDAGEPRWKWDLPSGAGGPVATARKD